MSAGKVIVYGGRGALGAAIVKHFKANNKIEAFQCLNQALNIDAENVEGLVARGWFSVHIFYLSLPTEYINLRARNLLRAM